MKRLLVTSAMSALVAASVTAASASGLVEIGLDDPHLIPPATIENGWGGVYGGISYGRTTSTRTFTEPQNPEPIYDVCVDNGGHSGGEKCVGDPDNIDLTFGPELGFHNGWKNTGLYNNQNRAFLKGEPVVVVDEEGNFLRNDIADGSNPSGTLYRLETGEVIQLGSPTFTEIANSDQFGAFVGYRHDFGTLVGGVEANVASTMQTVELQAGLDAGQLLPYGFVGAGSFNSEGGMVYGVGADLKLGQQGLMVGLKHTVGEFGDVSTGTSAVRIGWQF